MLRYDGKRIIRDKKAELRSVKEKRKPGNVCLPRDKSYILCAVITERKQTLYFIL